MLHALLLMAAMTVVHGRQADATPSATVRDAAHATLILDIELRPGVHVYAPGVENHIPIAWTLDESPAYRTHDIAMPPARRLYMQAIDETVPVYEGRLRLTREIDIHAKTPLEITGSLRYQACDDQMCYRPEKLALHWTVTVPR